MDLREIARRAKVSTATVSRTINHVRTVNPQLARRVWKVVEELGYFPNTQARAMVSGPKNEKDRLGRGVRIRTGGLLRPRQARYQAALRPDKSFNSSVVS